MFHLFKKFFGIRSSLNIFSSIRSTNSSKESASMVSSYSNCLSRLSLKYCAAFSKSLIILPITCMSESVFYYNSVFNNHAWKTSTLHTLRHSSCFKILLFSPLTTFTPIMINYVIIYHYEIKTRNVLPIWYSHIVEKS